MAASDWSTQECAKNVFGVKTCVLSVETDRNCLDFDAAPNDSMCAWTSKGTDRPCWKDAEAFLDLLNPKIEEEFWDHVKKASEVFDGALDELGDFEAQHIDLSEVCSNVVSGTQVHSVQHVAGYEETPAPTPTPGPCPFCVTHQNPIPPDAPGGWASLVYCNDDWDRYTKNCGFALCERSDTGVLECTSDQKVSPWCTGRWSQCEQLPTSDAKFKFFDVRDGGKPSKEREMDQARLASCDGSTFNPESRATGKNGGCLRPNSVLATLVSGNQELRGPDNAGPHDACAGECDNDSQSVVSFAPGRIATASLND